MPPSIFNIFSFYNVTFIKHAYLTIDDSPSKFTKNKVDFLKKNNIKAIFYCRGEFIKGNMNAVIYAIEKGFLIGNHSY